MFLSCARTKFFSINSLSKASTVGCIKFLCQTMHADFLTLECFILLYLLTLELAFFILFLLVALFGKNFCCSTFKYFILLYFAEFIT